MSIPAVRDRRDLLPSFRSSRLVLSAVVAVSVAAAMAYLAAPPMGIDLAAQVAHGEFWRRHGGAALDFGWFGGFSPFGYSLLTPAPMAWFGGGVSGAKVLGATGAVAASGVLSLLLLRTGAARRFVAGVLGAVGIFGNVVSGRVTFTVGLAFGLAALLALTCERPWQRRAGGFVAAMLAAAASPVAGLFVGLAGVAVMMAAGWRRAESRGYVGRRLDGLSVTVGAAVPTLGMAALFGVGGSMNSLPPDSLRAFTVSLLVAILVPHRAVRIGALLSAAGVLAAFLLSTPVGLNAGRLSATFALVALAGYAAAPTWLRVPAKLRSRLPRFAAWVCLLVGVALWQHPVAATDLRRSVDPAASPGNVQPLLDELARRGPVGRVEVVPTLHYWEAATVPGIVPIARGWLRQADVQRNPLFHTGSPVDSPAYRDWLIDNGVSLVAVSRVPAGAEGRGEARLLRTRHPYLRRVWRGGGWTLYEVAGAPSLVTGATLVSSTDGAVVVDVTSPGDVLVRVRWSRWMAMAGAPGCVEPAAGGWTTLRAQVPGRYTLFGSLRSGPSC